MNDLPRGQQEVIPGSPVGSECPALCAAHPPGTQNSGTEKHHVPVYLCPVCVCSQDSSKAQSTEEPRALPVYGIEKCRNLEWEKRCLSGEANREAGKFPGGSSRLANVFFRVPNSSAEVCGCSRSC